MEPRHIVGLSGGKDSTALALALCQFFPGPRYEFVCTPTGDELPVMVEHWARLEGLLGAPLQKLTDPTGGGLAWSDRADANAPQLQGSLVHAHPEDRADH